MGVITLWVLLRILTSIFVGYVSSLRPLTPLEISVQFLPPSIPVAQWLERVFVSPWMRWDALWYENIVSTGYSANNGTAQFHPLYPWSATILFKLGISPGLSLLIISSLAGIILFFFFFKLARLDLSSKDAFFALAIFSLAPPAFILFAPYSESLFLLFSVLCLYFSRNKNWWLAGLMAGLATLTRQQGVFLLIPLAWELWEFAGRTIKQALKQWAAWTAVVPVPLALSGWFLYRLFFLSDAGVNANDLHSFIYSAIISPSASQVVPMQRFIWPWQAFYFAFEKIYHQPNIDIWVNTVLGILFLLMLAIAWKKMRMSYRLYAIGIVLISFSYYTGPTHPYMGILRHLFLGFTIFIGLAVTISKSWIRIISIVMSSIGMITLLTLFVLNTWVP
jgi:Gpi18-like mannosyltransferase